MYIQLAFKSFQLHADCTLPNCEECEESDHSDMGKCTKCTGVFILHQGTCNHSKLLCIDIHVRLYNC